MSRGRLSNAPDMALTLPARAGLRSRAAQQDTSLTKAAERDLRAETTAVKELILKAEEGIRDYKVTGVQTCALPIYDCGGGGPLPQSLRSSLGAPAGGVLH